MNKKTNNSKLKNIFKLIITCVIIYCVVSAVISWLGKAKDTVSEFANSFVENHSVEYDTNTDSDNITQTTTDGGARKKYTTIKGNGEDDVTIMVYMIGTDLESSYGMGTADIKEMQRGKIADNTNLIIQTGGCSRWNNSVFADGKVERWVMNSNNFSKLQSLGKTAMTNPDTLTDFINYSADNFPANRYILILWDHGGGSEAGYGYDEVYPNAGSMSPDMIASALRKTNVKFDFIGFDACLMANLETAIAIEPYADYLIGSEETEPGEGWNYVNWIKLIEKDTSVPTLSVGKQIVDDYISSSIKSNGEITQSVIDLGELVYNIKTPLTTFSQATAEKLNSNEYQSIAIARSNTKEFSKASRLDQVDLIDLVTKFDVNGSDELVKGIKSAIKYNKTYNINNSYGLSAYFPYSSLSKVNSMVKIYDNIKMDKNYSNVVKSFATYASSGQIVTQNSGVSSNSLFDILMGDQYYTNDSYYNDNYYDSFSNSYGNYGYDGYGYDDSFGSGYEDWMGDAVVDIMTSFFRNNKLVKPASLNIINKNNQRVVSLSDDEWNLIDNVTLNLFINDGDGYIDLGKDNVFDWNDDGDLIVDSDGTWLAINESNVVSYEFVSDMYIDENNYKTVGYIPAYLNNERVNLVVNFTPENEYGVILGAQILYTDTNTQAKGLIEIKDGDELRFIANYYKYDGTFVDEYQIGDSLIANGELKLSNVHLDNDYVYAYCFKDIYGNNMWTPKTEIK